MIEVVHHLLHFDPPALDDMNGKILAMNDEFVVFYRPGRTVYIDSAQGSQYVESRNFLLARTGEKNTTEWVEEVFNWGK